MCQKKQVEHWAPSEFAKRVAATARTTQSPASTTFSLCDVGEVKARLPYQTQTMWPNTRPRVKAFHGESA